MNNNWTRSPNTYRTGGAVQRGAAMDACDLAAVVADTAWPNALCGGPLDAPDFMPTGAIRLSHGHLFVELVGREG